MHRDLPTLICAYNDTVRLLLSGHLHKATVWGQLCGVPSITLPAVRYNAQNWQVLELASDGGWRLAGFGAKTRNHSRCSDVFAFDRERPCGAYEKDYEGRDVGSCGWPSSDAAEEAGFAVADIDGPKDVPSQDVFNPSGACRWKFARAYMHACRGGASEACCSVLEPAFLPASGAPFAGCLCQRDMWDSVVSWFDAHSDFSAAAVMLACVDEYGKRILFTGGPIGFCEAEPWSGDGHGAASRKLPGPDNAEDAARRAG
uniref:Uncharacterized protein n=1 Tax=Chlamydomonas euryale TaxID=1486919 RepID=A0A6U2FSV5_9CHLO